MTQSKPYQLLSCLTVDEYEMLKNDIRSNGITYPIIYDESGNVLDGHHRLQIAEELRAEEGIRIDIPAIIRAGLSQWEKKALSLSLNLARRHLSQAQRRELIAAQLLDTPTSANTIIANSLGVTDKTVAAVRRDLESRSEIPTVTERLRTDGKTSPAKSTARSVVAKNQRETDRALAALSDMNADVLPNHQVDVKLLERIRRESHAAERAKGVETAPSVVGSADIRFGDFRSVLNDIPDSSADLVLADPPYARGHLGLWSELGVFAASKLREGGILATYCGQSHLPTVLAALSHHLEFIWVIAQTNRGLKTHNYHRKIYANWKPILIFARPPFVPKIWFDDLWPGGGPEKESHEWQQREDEARRLIEIFTHSGNLVIDPFSGSGTTAKACILSGRRCISADIDPKAVATSRERVRAVLQGQE